MINATLLLDNLGGLLLFWRSHSPEVLIYRESIFHATELFFCFNYSVQIFHDLSWCYRWSIIFQILLLRVFPKIFEGMLRFRFLVPLLDSLANFLPPGSLCKILRLDLVLRCLWHIIDPIRLNHLLRKQALKRHDGQPKVRWLWQWTLKLGERIIWRHVTATVLLRARLARELLVTRFVPDSKFNSTVVDALVVLITHRS